VPQFGTVGEDESGKYETCPVLSKSEMYSFFEFSERF
jgi:hypothetical protein